MADTVFQFGADGKMYVHGEEVVLASAIVTRVERLEARVTNLAELVESLAGGRPPSLGYWDCDEDIVGEEWDL